MAKQCVEFYRELERDPPPPAAWMADSWFLASAEPVLIVDAQSEHIVEANPAAAQLLGYGACDLVGTGFLQAFADSSIARLQGSLARTRTAGSAAAISVFTLKGGMRLTATISSFRASPRTYFLIRLAADISGLSGAVDGSSSVLRAIDGATIGFLVTDCGFLVQYANRTFVEMIEGGSEAEIRDESLTRWLNLTAVDMQRLNDQMVERRAVSLLCTSLRPKQGRTRGVEVCAVAVPDGQNTCWGFTVRELPLLN